MSRYLILLLLVLMSSSAWAQPPTGPEVTIKGNVLCHRAIMTSPWDGTSLDQDHYPIVYAVEGTPEIDATVADLMKGYWPARGLDVRAAQQLNGAWSQRLAYRIAPGELADIIHKDSEWGSQLLALTGVLYEKDGQRWIAVNKYEPTTVTYPAPLLAPDTPFVLPKGDPIALKVTDTLTLTCVPIPAGNFLQGSPFYQQRYQD